MRTNQFKGKKQVVKRSNLKKESYSLKEVHNLFITSKKVEGLRERTISDHLLHFGYFLKWLSDVNSEIMTCYELDVITVRNYIQFMEDKGLSPVTRNVRIRTLKCFLKFAHEEGFLPENISQKIKIVKTDKDTLKILTDEEVTKLIKVIDKSSYTGFRDFVAIMLMVDTGMRSVEVSSLTVDMHDFNNMLIYLPGSKVKNRIGRVIPLSSQTNKLLYQLIKENEIFFGEKHVFLSVYGTPFQSKSFRKRLVTYKHKAGIKGVRVSPHSFRHYFAKSYVLGGGDPFSLQKILGHSDMQMVRKYIQMSKSDVKIQHNRYSPVQRLKL
ncbi:integrase/recombinase XerD [Salirhabdus euzebyi]|uniref:Integrase/recombinase XerD n=1 Tax=Salirhabdus euzebyi TaxID=394506 RepID=A0A841Q7V4_9BACI|nr:tyrosine-type recombinase/integrase [Salirhabdus euzebyi]MBB6454404.1 integrase/recombinase XerD [Salirhabdus euzebyi]